jgi:rSAM/selenodomain-associated transferase 1
MKPRLLSPHVKYIAASPRLVTSSDCHLIVFAKAPVPGKVKTRLVPSLGALAAARLYERMVLHSLSTAVNSRVGLVHLWCTPSTEHPFLNRCAKEFQVALHLQENGDIGRRMAHAFQETLKVVTFALLLGTDCPSLTQDDLTEAVAALRRGSNVVFVPTEDGGYCLLGLSQYAPDLFKGISWGTAFVLEQTRARLRELGWSWHELTERWDVDRPEDVERLRSEGYLNLNEQSRKTTDREIGR